MSNIGKSYRTRQFAKTGKFTAVSIDDEISKSLELHSLGSISKWMGFPYDERYLLREQEYLEMEKAITRRPITAKNNVILDTTGSVIYLGSDVLDYLKNTFLIVEFQAGEEVLATLMAAFFTSPKPLVWSGHFNQADGETGNAALRRCYPELLRSRSSQYHALADISIPATISRDPQVSTSKFLEHIIMALPKATPKI